MKYVINSPFLFSFQVAHADIESHGQLIKSVVQLCDKYSKRSHKQRSHDLNNVHRQRHSIRHQPRPPDSGPIQSSVVSCTEVSATNDNNHPAKQTEALSQLHTKSPRLLSVGRVIERRWHCLWLRSLEWQCFLEQLTWTPRLRKKVSRLAYRLFPK